MSIDLVLRTTPAYTEVAHNHKWRSYMAPIISLFNHKGGVSKTTTAFNLGWAMADRGKKVLIVDGDPQCNLTGTVVGFNGVSDFSEFYKKYPNANISNCLAPIFKSTGQPLVPAHVTTTLHPNLFLLVGNIDLAENETQISVALSTSTAIPALKNIPGAISALLRMTAQEYNLDAVIVDMSPSVGALNQCFLMGSDYFIVPTSPDYYCNQAISSLSRVLPRWNSAVQPFRDASLLYPFPAAPPKFTGIISQRYRPRSGSPAQSFQQWIDVIKQTVLTEFVPAMTTNNMSVSVADFTASSPGDTPFNLINIADFNSLIAQSQKYNVPVFALKDHQIEQAGVILKTMKESRDAFKASFNNLANTVEIITGITPPKAKTATAL
ncbi:ParA family protein [Bradyrhizobium japonicum]|uniref:ParA family protein n=1 Tax=Bradyrhizobium japonicum TaxID=375 RepID=UPI00200D1362|nr:AAA family ATPase [Bradyrhizobium japonicum]UQD95234.1 AAA family ATPase [Bradyrhizobium japonicum]